MGTRRSQSGNRDGNHKAIVETLEAHGVLVQDLAGVGNGCPDLLIGYRDLLGVVEVKNGTLSPSKRKLRESQERWAERWTGFPVFILSKPDQVANLIDYMAGVADRLVLRLVLPRGTA